MEISPQVVNDVEFPLKVRGYDPDDVDDFLERMAVGVGQLQERLQQVTERAATAERRSAELEQRLRDVERPRGDRSEPAAPRDEVGELTRTLSMAQRFVDQAMKEAEDEAHTLVGQARADAERLRAEADAELRRVRTESHAQIAEEITELERTREMLRGDIEALGAHVEAQRDRLRRAVADFGRLLEDPDALRVTDAPSVSGATLPAFARDLVGAGGGDEEVVAIDEGPGPVRLAADVPEDQPAAERDDEPLLRAPVAPEDEAERDEPDEPDKPEGDGEGSHAAWARFAQGPEPAESGPPTASYADDPHDPYLAELRRAIDDAAATSSESQGLFDQDDHDEQGLRPRFERR
jgi:cell division initiation protein